MPKIELIQGDCLEKMKDIPDGSIDMILCDLPYGTTNCKWDTIIPFEPLWSCYKRIIKDNGAIALTASQPFTSALVMSNIKMFKYEWIWEKQKPTNFYQIKTQPLKSHENVLIFCIGKVSYRPQGTVMVNIKNGRKNKSSNLYSKYDGGNYIQTVGNYPRSVVHIPTEGDKNRLHPTQKPVALMEYLIKTYTNEGDTVLDNCMGSGTTGVACKNLNRNFIGIELDPESFKIAEKRINYENSYLLFSEILRCERWQEEEKSG
jgi:site-specific DNA-methyltransferase (adenine-specific)